MVRCAHSPLASLWSPCAAMQARFAERILVLCVRCARSAILPVMWRSMAFAVLTFGVVAATGCGGPSANSAANIDEFQAGAYRLLCDWQARCGQIGKSELQGCYDSYTVISSGPIDASGMVDAHRITFDPGAAGQCLEALSTASCGQFFSLSNTPGCLNAARGTVTPGAQCTVDLECTSGICSPMADGCTGKCVAAAATGAPCDAAPCN